MTPSRPGLAQLWYRGRFFALGSWPSRREADIAWDRAVLHFGLDRRLRVPKVSRRLGAASPGELKQQARVLQKANGFTSRFLGIQWRPEVELWKAAIWFDGYHWAIGLFRDEYTAATFYDRVARHLIGNRARLNFPRLRLAALSLEDARREARALRRSSRYRGVLREPKRLARRWQAQLYCPIVAPRSAAPGAEYEIIFLGRWETEREAATAHDRAALHYLGARARLNFAQLRRTLEPADANTLIAESRHAYKATTSSRFRGVKRFRTRWQAHICDGELSIHLGTFETEEEAATAYDKAALRLKGSNARLNFDPETGAVRPGQPRLTAAKPKLWRKKRRQTPRRAKLVRSRS